REEGEVMLGRETGTKRRPRRLRHTAARCRGIATSAFLLLLGSACVDILAQNAPGALRTAESRAKFELNCPDVQASILSQKTLQAVRSEGSEHTIGVRGCGRQAIYETFCRDANDCNAIAQTGRTANVGEMAP